MFHLCTEKFTYNFALTKELNLLYNRNLLFENIEWKINKIRKNYGKFTA